MKVYNTGYSGHHVIHVAHNATTDNSALILELDISSSEFKDCKREAIIRLHQLKQEIDQCIKIISECGEDAYQQPFKNKL